MNSFVKKIVLVAPIALLSLTSCGGSAIAKKGYNLWKDQIAEYYKSIGGTGKEIQCNSCYYVWIKGSGTIDAGSLAGNVYYNINYTLNLKTTSTSFNTCVVYFSNNDLVGEGSAVMYKYAYDLVENGSLDGKTGKL